MKNYYEILEVSSQASPEIIEKAYKTLARRYHPDVQPRDKVYWAEAEFKKVVEAYEVLSNPERRKRYDMMLTQNSNNKNYNEEYNNLYSEQENLKREIAFLKSKNNSRQDNGSKKEPADNSKMSFMKSYVQSVSNAAYQFTKKDKNERSKDIKIFLLAVLIVGILFIIFWNVPFLKKILLF